MDANCERNPRHDRFRCRCHLERAILRQIYGIRFRYQLDPDGMGDHSGPPVAIAERRLGRAIDPTARELIRDASIRKEGTGLRLSRRPLVSAIDAPLSVLCKSRYSSIQPGARATMIRSTHNPEAGHLLIFVVTIGITLWATVSGWWSTVAWLLLFNLLHNVYPMLSMRQLRARLARH